MASPRNNSKTNNSDDFIRIQDLFFLCVAHWRWFVLSLAVTVGVACIYILRTHPTYTRTASILIKDESGKTSSDMASTFAEMGLFQQTSNVYNELIAIQSPSVIEEVVRRLSLNVQYTVPTRLYQRVIYGNTLPVTVAFLDVSDEENASLNLTPGGADGTGVTLSDFTLKGQPLADESIEGLLNDTLSTPVGRLVVSPTPAHVSGTTPFNQPIHVSCGSILQATRACKAALTVGLSDEKASVIDITLSDLNTRRAEDIINTIIAVYNENWVKDKNQIAVSTSLFINERLNVIESELGNVDEDISSFKSENLLPDVQAASSMYMSQSSQTNAEILALNTQLSMAKYIRDYITSASNRTQLLPANSGLESDGIAAQIAEYNSMQLQRNNLVANSSEENPLVVDLDRSLSTLRGAIVSSIDNLMVTLNTRIRHLERSEQQTTARIAANPTQAKYLLSVERQQKVKEALYLFLLQKREENELSQAFTAYNTRLIAPPNGSNLPTAPVKRNILLVAIALGLLIPIAVIFLIENTNTSVRGRKDIESLTIPFVGEIPLYSPRRRHLHERLLERIRGIKPSQQTGQTIVVRERSRNVINEAFRVVRTNLEFMLGREGTTKNIMVTSVNSGSGKTFTTVNLATSLAIKGKHVLAIDLDLRKASLSGYVGKPKQGVADYLAGRADSYRDLIIGGQTHPNLDILPVGTMPPNPTELLFSDRLSDMLQDLRQQYDYIFIDCPPVEIVADASIIGKYAELTLFIIRAGLVDRSMLPEVERYYTDHKYNNLSLILNGTEGGSGRYGYKYGYKYGYRYGYKYGYHTGYYGNADDKEN